MYIIVIYARKQHQLETLIWFFLQKRKAAFFAKLIYRSAMYVTKRLDTVLNCIWRQNITILLRNQMFKYSKRALLFLSTRFSLLFFCTMQYVRNDLSTMNWSFVMRCAYIDRTLQVHRGRLDRVLSFPILSHWFRAKHVAKHVKDTSYTLPPFQFVAYSPIAKRPTPWHLTRFSFFLRFDYSSRRNLYISSLWNNEARKRTYLNYVSAALRGYRRLRSSVSYDETFKDATSTWKKEKNRSRDQIVMGKPYLDLIESNLCVCRINSRLQCCGVNEFSQKVYKDRRALYRDDVDCSRN